ncbi:MAG: D-alanyl-D-alanine carboxypeptidase [Acidimicrobiales bacterium]|jgi:D-alanyl-D-alanine carboxypeptidase (penicillin-binding protein 5/6)
MDGNDSGGKRGPAHARKPALPRENEERLVALGRQLPPPSEDELEIVAGLRSSRRRRRLLTWGTTLIVMALGAGAIAQWVRPLPHAELTSQVVRLPGTAPTFAWPSSGESAAVVVGVGAVGQVRGSQSVPVAGLAELLTAYVVLSDHRLAPGANGPSIPVTADALAAYQAGQAGQEAEVPIAAGESLTELEALEGLLVDSGADMATVLADWDAGSVTAFVAKMNATASKLGLVSTHITDPSGVDPATTSTAEDLVRLGEASLSIPVLGQIVSLAQASVPMTTVVYNPDFDLGVDGIIGMKTGSDSSAQGCYLFAAQQNIGGKNVTVVGAVLGQPGGALGPTTAAVDAGDALVRSVFAALHSFTVFAPGQEFAQMDTAWGSTAPVTVARPLDVLGWPGLVADLVVRHRPVDGALPSGSPVGTVRAGVGGTSTRAELRMGSALSGPGVWWRLTR